MAASPWIPPVKRKQVLTVYNDMNTARWMKIFGMALEMFNKLSKDHTLHVTMTEAKEEKGAEVLMKVATGPVSHTFEGTKNSAPFDPKRLHGHTMLLGYASNKAGIDKELAQAVAFLPSEPQAEGGAATLDMLKVIAVHELVHACGLDNKEHAKDGLFYSPLAPTAGKLIVPEQGKNNRPMPPVWLDQPTITKIQGLWKK